MGEAFLVGSSSGRTLISFLEVVMCLTGCFEVVVIVVLGEDLRCSVVKRVDDGMGLLVLDLGLDFFLLPNLSNLSTIFCILDFGLPGFLLFSRIVLILLNAFSLTPLPVLCLCLCRPICALQALALLSNSANSSGVNMAAMSGKAAIKTSGGIPSRSLGSTPSGRGASGGMEQGSSPGGKISASGLRVDGLNVVVDNVGTAAGTGAAVG